MRRLLTAIFATAALLLSSSAASAAPWLVTVSVLVVSHVNVTPTSATMDFTKVNCH